MHFKFDFGTMKWLTAFLRFFLAARDSTFGNQVHRSCQGIAITGADTRRITPTSCPRRVGTIRLGTRGCFLFHPPRAEISVSHGLILQFSIGLILCFTRADIYMLQWADTLSHTLSRNPPSLVQTKCSCFVLCYLSLAIISNVVGSR